MCAVSFISDHYWRKWPEPESYPIGGAVVPWQEYQELKRKAEEYDKMTKQPDCQKPELDAWEKRMEEFLKQKGLL